MTRPIVIILLPPAEDFILSQEKKVQTKFLKAFDMTRSGYHGRWFKKMAGTNGLFEFRIKEDGNYYRLFAFWDKRRKTETLIVCTNGLVKKTDKTPARELKKAETIMNDYFNN